MDAVIAFDKIQHPFMIKALQKVETEEMNLNIIKVIYDKPATNILNSEKLKTFPLRRGTRDKGVHCFGGCDVFNVFPSFIQLDTNVSKSCCNNKQERHLLAPAEVFVFQGRDKPESEGKRSSFKKATSYRPRGACSVPRVHCLNGQVLWISSARKYKRPASALKAESPLSRQPPGSTLRGTQEPSGLLGEGGK